jgi:ribosome maturation factor RimP
MEIAAEIRRMVEERLADPAHFVVDVMVSMRRPPYKATVMVDGDQGITIDDCASISRKLSSALEEQALLGDQYTLEVTTPGLDQPLKMLRQYKKNVGRKLKVKLSEGLIEGRLLGVTQECITVEQQVTEGKKQTVAVREIPFSGIEKAFVLVSFK